MKAKHHSPTGLPLGDKPLVRVHLRSTCEVHYPPNRQHTNTTKPRRAATTKEPLTHGRPT